MDSDTLEKILKILHDSFLACTRLCDHLPNTLQQLRNEQPATADLDVRLIRSHLEETLCPIYENMTEAMFRVAHQLYPWLQTINVYLWPGYHSLIVHDRVDYIFGRAPCGVGVADGNNGIEHYRLCSNSRWHSILFDTTSVHGAPTFVPPSLHHWFVSQKPKLSDDPYDIVHSLVLSTDPIAESPEFKGFSIGPADQHTSRGWGEQLSRKLHEWQAQVENPAWKFPDRYDLTREEEDNLREVRCLAYSLWLHAAFGQSPPDWLDEAETLFAKSGFDQQVKQIQRTRGDSTGADWGDATKGRERLHAMTIICLHRLLAHAVLTKQSYRAASENDEFDDRSLGTVCLFSSFTPDRCFIELVRPWMRSLFAMIRNSELTVYASKLIQTLSARERLRGAGFLSHEIHSILKENSSIRLQMKSTDTDSVAARCFAWDLLSATAHLAWEVGKLSILAKREVRTAVADEFLLPIIELQSAGVLEDAFTAVASQVHAVVKPATEAQGTSVALLERRREMDLTPQQYSRCYLLVAEPIRNCRRYATVNAETDWRVSCRDGDLNIVLEQAEANFLPTSETFETLSDLLQQLGIGSTAIEWDKAHQRIVWTVKVSLQNYRRVADETAIPQAAAD